MMISHLNVRLQSVNVSHFLWRLWLLSLTDYNDNLIDYCNSYSSQWTIKIWETGKMYVKWSCALRYTVVYTNVILSILTNGPCSLPDLSVIRRRVSVGVAVVMGNGHVV